MQPPLLTSQPLLRPDAAPSMVARAAHLHRLGVQPRSSCQLCGCYMWQCGHRHLPGPHRPRPAARSATVASGRGYAADVAADDDEGDFGQPGSVRFLLPCGASRGAGGASGQSLTDASANCADSSASPASVLQVEPGGLLAAPSGRLEPLVGDSRGGERCVAPGSTSARGDADWGVDLGGQGPTAGGDGDKTRLGWEEGACSEGWKCQGQGVVAGERTVPDAPQRRQPCSAQEQRQGPQRKAPRRGSGDAPESGDRREQPELLGGASNPWDPGPVLGQLCVGDSGPGPPPPPSPLPPPPSRHPPLEQQPPPTQELWHSQADAAMMPHPRSSAAGASPRPPKSGPLFGRDAQESLSPAAIFPGVAFRAALRCCTCLDELEQVLSPGVPDFDGAVAAKGQAEMSGTNGLGGAAAAKLLPPAWLTVPDALSAPALTAVLSTLTRLPETFTTTGRRRVRQFLVSRLAPLVLSRRQELDGAGAAIMAAALARLGPDVVDPRVDSGMACQLIEALAESGLAACRLPPVLGAPGGGGPDQRHGGGGSARRTGAGTDAAEVIEELVPRPGRHTPEPAQHPQPLCTSASQPPQYRQHSQDLRPPLPPPSRSRPHGHTPRSYSTLLYALAKMGFRPDEFWLARYVGASAAWLHAFPARDLAATAWALAVLGYRPGEAWLGLLLEAWPTAMATARVGAAAASGADYNHGSAVGADAAEAVPESAQTQSRLKSSSGSSGGGGGSSRCRADAHSLSLLLWALWRLGVAAPADWLDGALRLCALPATSRGTSEAISGGGGGVPFPGATCQSLGLVSYSLARMGHTPPAAVRDALLAAASPLLQRGSAQDLVLLLVGVAHWPSQLSAVGAGPLRGGQVGGREADGAAGGLEDVVAHSTTAAPTPHAWRYAAAVGGAGPALPPVQAPVPAPVPAAWLQQLCLALQQQLPTCSSQGLVMALSALAHLRYRPGAAWLAAHEEAIRRVLAAGGGGLNGKAVARVASAWARLGHRPGGNVLGRLLRLLVAAAAAAPSSSPPHLVVRDGRGEWLSARLFAEGLYGIAALVAARRGRDDSENTPANAAAKSTSEPSTIKHSALTGPFAVHRGADPAVVSPPPYPLLASIHVRALLAASQRRLDHSYLDQALLHLRAWRLLRVAPPAPWLAHLATVARTKLHAAPPSVLLELLRLLAWPGWQRFRGGSEHGPEPALRPYRSAEAAYQSPPGPHAFHQTRQPSLPSGSASQRQRIPAVQGMQGPGSHRPEVGLGVEVGSRGPPLPISASLVGAVVQRLTPYLPYMELDELVDLAAALVALGVRPPVSWLRQLLAAMRECFPQGATLQGRAQRQRDLEEADALGMTTAIGADAAAGPLREWLVQTGEAPEVVLPGAGWGAEVSALEGRGGGYDGLQGRPVAAPGPAAAANGTEEVDGCADALPYMLALRSLRQLVAWAGDLELRLEIDQLGAEVVAGTRQAGSGAHTRAEPVRAVREVHSGVAVVEAAL